MPASAVLGFEVSSPPPPSNRVGKMSHSDLTGDEAARLLPRGAGSSDDGGASLPSSRPSSPPRTKSSERSKSPQRFWKALRAVIGFLLSNWYKFAILGIVITLIVLVSIHGFSIFPAILEWFKKRSGWGGWGAYLGIYTAIVALFIPGVVFIMGAGFVFGFWRGLLAVWLGGSIGQALAFLLARYLLRDWVESFVNNKWKKWKYIDAALEKDGWKLVLIMRLSPIIPYNLLNIAMATTSIHFLAFALVSSVGILFECGIFVYLGTIADGITSIVEGGKGGKPKAIQWVLLGLSIFMGIVGAVFVSVMVRRAVRKADELGVEGVLDGVGGAGDGDENGDGGATLLMLSPERNHSGSSRWQQYGRNFPEVSEIDVMERGGGYWRRVEGEKAKEKEKAKTSPRGVDRSNGNGNGNGNGNKDNDGTTTTTATTATTAATMDASSSVSPLRIRKRGDSASDTSLIQ